MARTIVLGYDGSECSKAALEAAVANAQGSPDCRIVVVNGHVVFRIWGGKNFTGIRPPDPTDVEDLKRHAQANIQPLLDEASARIAAAGLAVETTVEWEHPATALLDVAKEYNADLIVVGTHGTDAMGRAIGRVLLGSTPTKLVHWSRIPVLVVPLPE